MMEFDGKTWIQTAADFFEPSGPARFGFSPFQPEQDPAERRTDYDKRYVEIVTWKQAISIEAGSNWRILFYDRHLLHGNKRPP
jgi:hypothetical protein